MHALKCQAFSLISLRTMSEETKEDEEEKEEEKKDDSEDASLACAELLRLALLSKDLTALSKRRRRRDFPKTGK